MNDAQIAILLKARDEATKVLDSVAAHAKKLGGTMGTALKVGGIAAGVGIAAAGFALFKFGKMAAEEQVGVKRLETALATLDDAHRGSAAEVEKVVAARQKLAFSDDAIRDSLSQLIPATGDYEEAVRRQAIAMDVARGTGLDLSTASRLLGKVNEESINVFKRYGITLEEGTSQTEALAAIQAKFAGQSEAYAETTAAKWEIFNITLDNLKETIGGALLPVAGLLGEALTAGLEKATPHIERAVGHFQTLADFFSGALTGNVEAAAAAFAKLPEPLQQIVLWLVTNDIKGKLEAAADVIGGVLLDSLTGWRDILIELGPKLATFGQWLVDHEPVLFVIAAGAVAILAVMIGWPGVILAAALAVGFLATKLQEWREQNELLDGSLRGLGVIIEGITGLIRLFTENTVLSTMAMIGLAVTFAPVIIAGAALSGVLYVLGNAGQIAGGIFDWFADRVDDVKDAINRLGDAIRSLPDMGNLIPDLPSIPGTGGVRKRFGLAAGGIAQGWQLVGEQGRELIHVGTPSRVYNNGETEAMLGGGNTITVNIYGPASGEDVASEIDRYFRR